MKEELFQEELETIKTSVNSIISPYDNFPDKEFLTDVTFFLKEQMMAVYGDPLSARIHLKLFEKSIQDAAEMLKDLATDFINEMNVQKRILWKNVYVTPTNFGPGKITTFSDKLRQQITEIEIDILLAKQNVEDLENKKRHLMIEGQETGDIKTTFSENSRADGHRIEFRKK